MMNMNLRLPRALCIVCVSVLLAACATKSTQPPVQKAIAGKVSTQKTDGKQCVDNFDLLKKLNYDAFLKYRQQFDVINQSYDYYKTNDVLMENDPKEQMTLTLNDKLNMICERVKSQTYNEIRKKMKSVSKI
ncbi:hypothetical protein NNO04_21900 [Citrobacter sp. Awk 4]|uniref:hypothetical protein n=1 Tax=Citrobacter sp. Awk 4 TaxID=2963955 RepID=UPI0023036125|nr:hypothetical protein [Citrobacter sp. Awk 4]MDA8481313.1 hypothetical protein [Citrobacter sp. Awk 4]